MVAFMWGAWPIFLLHTVVEKELKQEWQHSSDDQTNIGKYRVSYYINLAKNQKSKIHDDYFMKKGYVKMSKINMFLK